MGSVARYSRNCDVRSTVDGDAVILIVNRSTLNGDSIAVGNIEPVSVVCSWETRRFRIWRITRAIIHVQVRDRQAIVAGEAKAMDRPILDV